MSNEEKFKQSLKSLVESKEFVFDDKDWEKAAAYISHKRSGNTIRRMGLLLLAVAGLIGTSVLLISPGAVSTKQTAVKAQAPVDQPAEPINNKNPQSTTSVESKTTVETDNNVRTEREIINQKTKANKVSSPKSAVTTSPGQPEEKVHDQGVISVTFAKKNKSNDDNRGDNEVQTPAEPVTPAVANLDTGSGKGVAELTTQNVIPVAEEKENKTETREDNKQLVAAAVEASATTVLPANDRKDVPDSIKARIPRVMLFSLEAGTSYQPGWKNEGSVRDADGFNPVAGIHYMSAIDERFTLSFGLQYQRTGHLDAFSHTSKQSRYSFGEESEVTTITPSKLHYLAVPIRAYYKVDDKTSIGGSYSIGYLLDVEANVETYTLKVGKQSNNKSYTTRGYTDGFALFDSQVSLFCRRNVFRSFYVHGEVYFGLNDVKQNNFFGGNKAQRNSGLRLMLVYGIYSRNK